MYANSYQKELVIGDASQDIRTRASIRDALNYFVFVSHIEPKTIIEVEKDANWIMAVQEEFNQF